MVDKFQSSHLLFLEPASNRAQQFLFTFYTQLFTQTAVFALAMSSCLLGNQKDLIPRSKYTQKQDSGLPTLKRRALN